MGHVAEHSNQHHSVCKTAAFIKLHKWSCSAEEQFLVDSSVYDEHSMRVEANIRADVWAAVSLCLWAKKTRLPVHVPALLFNIHVNQGQRWQGLKLQGFKR